MDSLLANYASDDDEEGESEPQTQSQPSVLPTPSSLTVHLPPPNSTTTTSSSSLFSSLPPPKPTKSNLFSTLPPPKPQPPQKPSPLARNPKKTIQFTLPINPSVLDAYDDDDEVEQKKPIKDLSSSAAPKALSSMLPAPKNSLCLAPAASRKSIIESQPQAQLPISEAESFPIEEARSGLESYGGHGGEEGVSGYENYGGHNSEGSGWEARYGGGEEYGGYRGSWMDGNVAVAPAPAPEVYDIGRIAGKRGRNEIPTEILEVKQDELMKNRPREDQVKLTGIAFGPAYQPVSTSKGKPSKLHKRKHQIGSLYFDMRQKEAELAERRAKGFLTKAETQAKYGW